MRRAPCPAQGTPVGCRDEGFAESVPKLPGFWIIKYICNFIEWHIGETEKHTSQRKLLGFHSEKAHFTSRAPPASPQPNFAANVAPSRDPSLPAHQESQNSTGKYFWNVCRIQFTASHHSKSPCRHQGWGNQCKRNSGSSEWLRHAPCSSLHPSHVPQLCSSLSIPLPEFWPRCCRHMSKVRPRPRDPPASQLDQELARRNLS